MKNINELNENKKVAELFRGYMNHAVRSPGVREAKQALIQTYFSPAQPLWEPAFAFAGVALMALFAFFIHLQSLNPAISPRPETRQFVLAKEVAAQKIQYQMPRIEVKRASSKMGTVMVYQKVYDHIPYTIVWVFVPTTNPS